MPNSVEIEAKRRKRGKWLCRAGWAMFGLSLILPAIPGVFQGWFTGWDCSMITGQILWDWVTANEGGMRDAAGLYYAGFAVANALLLISPLLNRTFRGDLRRLRRLGIVLGVSSVYVASYFLLSVPSGTWTVLNAGYYAWLLSFGLVTVGTLQLSKKRSMSVINQRPTSIMRTEEEMAAVRELEDYLHGITRPASEHSVSAPAQTEPAPAELRLFNRLVRTHHPWEHSPATPA